MGDRAPAQRRHPFATAGEDDGFATFAGFDVEAPPAFNPSVFRGFSTGAEEEVDCLGWLVGFGELGGMGEVESADGALGVTEDSLSSRMSGTRSAGWQ